MAATLDEILFQTEEIARHLFLGHGPGSQTMEGAVDGIAARTIKSAGQTDAIQKQVADSGSLLVAVNEQTLGRIETKAGALGIQAASLSDAVRDVATEIQGVRQDIAALNAKIDDLSASVGKDLAGIVELHRAIAGIKQDVANLPQRP